MQPGLDEIAQEHPGVTGAAATADHDERRGGDIEAPCNLGDRTALARDARDDVRALADLAGHR